MYSIVMNQNNPKRDNIVVCQKFARSWVKNKDKCAIYVDCTKVNIISPAVLKEQSQFLDELEVTGNNDVKRVGFVADGISGTMLNKLLQVLIY